MRKILLVALVFSSQIWAQNNVAACKIISKINALIQKEHVQPKPVDDSLSVFVFDNLINDLDPARNLFFKSEYDSLAKNYRLKIDDLLQNEDCQFISTIENIYKKGLLRNKILLEKLATDSIDFSFRDTIRMYKKAFPVYMTESNFEKIWRKKIRFDVLTEVAGSSKNLDSIQTHFKSLSDYYKEIGIQNEMCKINNQLKRKSTIAEKVYSFFCTYFDPHTNYFSVDSKSNFVSSLSKERLSLGFLVTLNEKNQIIIDEIDPNGPAFKNGKLKKGDQILSISNEKETLKVTCASLEEIGELIISDVNKIITLGIKRKGEKSFSVTLEKEVIKDEQNTVFSYVVEDKNKIGYIKIPSFYSNFESNDKTGCADDVGTEIVKLQNDNIDGLVIDLMDNGGGSMEEAIKLAGLFVHHGPISIVVDNTKKQQVIQDPYRGYLYKGPVIILVNGNSASASEFFAAILQDYNRAMVIGSSTLGKATMQTILPLESAEENFVKVTINKFYRITGKSHQSIGVIPDVQVPIIYESIVQKEKDYPTAFKNDVLPTSITFKPYVKNKLINQLAKNSQKRVFSSSYFKSIIGMNKKIDELVKNPRTIIPMQIDTVFEEQKAVTSLWESISSFKDESINLNVKNSSFNESLLEVYPSERTIKETQIKALKNNHYLNEAIKIINDYFVLK
ncbi:S41 family peptidase [Flavobacterium sp.]|uniref:S41 family peptidase n=1 Tax=Flavobacterium sp. TaxID=239 RepID=UPI0022BEEC79|nr:S41 family peptidase [Flavobacterium sp.]MCZ8227860.1 S41 family peptidase [Flavobacterium sp.]